jgi:hypothetical protein
MLEKRKRGDERKTNETNLETIGASERRSKWKPRIRWGDKICTMGNRRIRTNGRRIKKWTKCNRREREYSGSVGTKKRRSTCEKSSENGNQCSEKE